ncbi:hypothetical protein [Parapedobacter koreensis]|uniref:Uncharacterized protein n=1 Tax=Parapedobacter koreensis TaxID=332977 RepID=A0A1H7MS24_9SPHI|nr:hypothetical protein [Parapedobacter koreensis]SEL13608.1 hypothetical protein SAMN05421740_103612 [Parapedobacter koreensis]
MALLTIKVPQNAKSRITEFVKELGGEVLSVKRESSDAKKEVLLKGIEQGLSEVRQIRAGKTKF